MSVQSSVQILDLPYNAMQQVFSQLETLDLAHASRVCKLWHALVNDDFVRRAVRPRGFGAKEWDTYLGNVGIEPALKNIHRILKNPCRWWSGKKIEHTHSLLLIPQSVNGIPMTPNRLFDLITHPLSGTPAKIYQTHHRFAQIMAQIGDEPILRSYWILITNELIPTTKNKKYNEQKTEIEASLLYAIPKVIEVSAFILTKFISERECFYPDKPHRNYSRCAEQVLVEGLTLEHVLVGCFSEEQGISLSSSEVSVKHIGMAGVIRL